MRQGLSYQEKIMQGDKSTFDYPISESRKDKLDDTVVSEIIQFVKDHEHVRQLSNMNDTLK